MYDQLIFLNKYLCSFLTDSMYRTNFLCFKVTDKFIEVGIF